MISYFFLGEELNLQQFYLCVLNIEWFRKPFSILYWEQEAGSARRPLHAFFRGSCSASAPASCTLYRNDSFRTAQQQIDAVFSRNVYRAPCNACTSK